MTYGAKVGLLMTIFSVVLVDLELTVLSSIDFELLVHVDCVGMAPAVDPFIFTLVVDDTTSGGFAILN